MPEKILFQAAEAIIIKQGNNIIKRRIKKGYRIPEIDTKLRKLRTRSESRIMEKASKFISVPKIIKVSEQQKEIEMEFIKGEKLSEYLDKASNKLEIAKSIGQEVSKLHDNNIIHSDLTTSNMILKEKQVYLIDFGLSFQSSRIEDKAVDIHLFKQALEAKHFSQYKQLFEAFLKGYNPKDKSKILSQLEKVELRGRYKHE
jgi:Kae1-associated kinase Bud32